MADVLLAHPHVLILADDIYEHLIFDDHWFYTLAQVEPRLAARTLTMITAIQLAMPCWRSTRMKLHTPDIKPPSAITPG